MACKKKWLRKNYLHWWNCWSFELISTILYSIYLFLHINTVCIQPIISWRYCCSCGWIYSQCYPGACAIFYRTHTICYLKLLSSVSSQITVCLLYIIQVRYRTYCRLTSLQMYVCNDNDVEELWWCHISMSLYFPVVLICIKKKKTSRILFLIDPRR